ncbi:hypothetical protein MMC28_003970 [Mycoblastus sanguinarius]|nr:hypothetical protein [Mycoblastus sanguinarius]
MSPFLDAKADPVILRKQSFIYSQNSRLKQKMEKHVADIYKFLDPFRNHDDCHLHPQPPHLDGRSTRKIYRNFYWTDDSGTHKLGVNAGLILLIMEHYLTDAQKAGYINQSWQLSHLCGNWTCCNWRHLTVESGPINVSRNACFRSPGVCRHSPPCMKDKKRQLLVTHVTCRTIRDAIVSLQYYLCIEDYLDFLNSGASAFKEQIWENGKLGWCGLCGSLNRSPHICWPVNCLEKCKQMLQILQFSAQLVPEVGPAIEYLSKIKEDLKKSRVVGNLAAPVDT